MLTVDSPLAMAEWSRRTRSQGNSIAFVPTMGYLHEGHLSLMRAARQRGDRVVVSIFVNPLQFGVGEDLEAYPRDPEGDAEKCRSVGCDVLFLPSKANMYPRGFQTTVVAGSLAGPLCGASRPGHFDGVVTVVLKLFNVVKPHVAVFGRKDFQQFAVLSRMVRDLDLDVEMVGMPIVREADGLALSSRNAYLSAAERGQAAVLSRALQAARADFDAGVRSAARLRDAIRTRIQQQPLARVDYVDVLDAEELDVPSDPISRPVVAAIAVHFGRTRLIDNVLLKP
jgi:pantoate--beta-alanine ligase